MRMKWVALVAATAVALVGCEESDPKPDARRTPSAAVPSPDTAAPAPTAPTEVQAPIEAAAPPPPAALPSQPAPPAAATGVPGPPAPGRPSSARPTTPAPSLPAVPSPPRSVPGPGTPGWLLTAGNTGLAAHGLNCDALPKYEGPSDPPAGTVISGKRVETALSLYAGNITIEKTCIRPLKLGRTAPLLTSNGPCGSDSCAVTSGPVVIRDSNIDGSRLSADTIAGSCAFLGIGTLQRNNITGMGSGICFYNTGHTLNGLAEGNYVHELRTSGDAHNDGATVRDFPRDRVPGRTLVIRNNRIDCSTGQDTGALFIQTHGNNIDGVTIEGNLLEGGGYQLGMEAGFGHVYGRDMRAINNRFSGTGWGPTYVETKGLAYRWAEWSDNFLHNPKAADQRGTAVRSG